MKRIALAILAIMILSGPALAAGTATWTVIDVPGKWNIYRCAWTSHTDGTVSAGTGVNAITVTGKIRGVIFKSVATAIPTNLYDVEILNAAGENIIYNSMDAVNVGADIPSAVTSTEQRRSVFNKDGGPKILYQEVLTPSITSAGNATQGIIDLIIE